MSDRYTDDDKYNEGYAKEYLKHQPDGLIVCIVTFRGDLVGVYTPSELMSATIPYPAEIKYMPVIGWSNAGFNPHQKQVIGWEKRDYSLGFSQNLKPFTISEKTSFTFSQNKPKDEPKNLII